MQALLEVTLPVFLVIGFGYAAAWRGLFAEEWTDGMMKFTQNFAFPCVLFLAMARIDLKQNFDLPLLASFYTGSYVGFILGLAGARLLFKRAWEDSVAIGFTAMFANTLLLGLPITERAYGPGALEANYAIIALNAPLCYLLGMTMMEIVRNRGGRPLQMARNILRSVFRNALIVGISLGMAVNLVGLPLPQVLVDAIELLAKSALPAALFALGAVLFRYRPEGDMRAILFVCVITLIIHPTITWTIGNWLGLSTAQMRSAVLTAAMAPGVNAYVFANLYGVAKRVAASAVLIGTALSILTVTFWLHVLP